MTDTSNNVAIAALVIPDGIVGNRLRFSISLSPRPKDPAHKGDAQGVDLADWTNAVNKRAKNITALWAEIGSDGKTLSAATQLSDTYHSDLLNPNGTPVAGYKPNDALFQWNKILGGVKADALEDAYLNGLAQAATAAGRSIRGGADQIIGGDAAATGRGVRNGSHQVVGAGATYGAKHLAADLEHLYAITTKASAARITAGGDGRGIVDLRQYARKFDVPFWIAFNRVMRDGDTCDSRHIAKVASYAPEGDERLVAMAGRVGEFVRYQGRMRRGPGPCDESAINNAVLGKLGALASYPALAKFVGLIVDVYVPLASFPFAVNAAKRYAVQLQLQVDHPDQNSPYDTIRTPWSACHYDGAGPTDYFGPRAQDPDRIKNGLLNLKAPGRFALSTIEPTGSLNALLGLSKQMADADQTNTSDDGHIELPEVSAPGIILHDEMPGQAVTAAGRSATATSVGSDAHELLWAEDLMAGYRIDVGVATTSDRGQSWKMPSDPTNWRSLCSRVLKYPGTLDDSFLKLTTPTRDDGHVRPMVNSTTNNFHPQIFAWTGESLAMPVPRTKTKPDQNGRYNLVADGTDSLPIELLFDLPPENSDLTLPPLRDGQAYVFGARICYQNGCGRSLEATRDDYLAAGSPVLGDNQGKPYVFRRRNKVRAPDILLPWTEPLADPGTLPTKLGGESLDRIVVRENGNDSSQRCLVPPRIPFSLMEQNSGFDASDIDDPIPPGMFEDHKAMRVETKEIGQSTMFPLVKEPAANQASTPSNPDAANRGSFLNVDKNMPKPAHPYYPDPLGRRVGARLIHIENPPSTAVAAFWEYGTRYTMAKPVVINLTKRDKGAGITLDAKSHGPVRDRQDAPFGRASWLVPYINVGLPAAESVELEYWSFPDADTGIRDHQAVFEIGSASTAETSLKEAPVANLSFSRTITLTHAVKQPFDLPPNTPALDVVPVVVKETGNSSNGNAATAAWQAHIDAALKKGRRKALREWTPQDFRSAALASEEGGTTTYFVGDAAVDGLSTGSWRCEARWLNFETDSIRKGKDGWESRPQTDTRKLFEIKTIDKNASVLRLASDDQSRPRGLGYNFKNGAARRLLMRSIATSRFTDCFEEEKTPPYSDDPSVGPFESRSGTFETAVNVWVPCVFQPPKPVIDKVLPVFSWSKTVDEPRTGKQIHWTRRIKMRVYLARPWHISGEGEKVALLFSDGSVKGGDPSVDDLLEKFVTVWGHDLAHRSEGDRITSPYVSPDSVEIEGAELKDLQLRSPTPSPLRVKALAVHPTLDTDSGFWYVDVGFKNDAAISYFPFIQFAVARYQEHAVEQLELSLPQSHWTQIPPRRDLQLDFSSNGKTVKLKYWGCSFSRGPDLPDGNTSEELQQPVVRARVMRAEAISLGASLIVTRWLPSEKVPEITLPPPHANGPVFTWERTIDTQASREKSGIFIEECEMLPADVFDSSIPIDSDHDGLTTKIVKRAPFLSRIFEFDPNSGDDEN